MQANGLPFYTPSIPVWGQNIFFRRRLCCISHYAIKMFDLMHTPDILGWVKRSDIEIVQINIIWLNLMTWSLSDYQDGLKCWRIGFIFCGKHPLLLTWIQMSYPGPMGPLVFILCFFLTEYKLAERQIKAKYLDMYMPELTVLTQ